MSVRGAATPLLLNSTDTFFYFLIWVNTFQCKQRSFPCPFTSSLFCLYNCIMTKKSIHHDINTQRTNRCLLSAINNRDCATLSSFHTVVVIMAANGPDNVPSQSLGKSRASLWLLVLRLLSTRMKKKQSTSRHRNEASGRGKLIWSSLSLPRRYPIGLYNQHHCVFKNVGLLLPRPMRQKLTLNGLFQHREMASHVARTAVVPLPAKLWSANTALLA